MAAQGVDVYMMTPDKDYVQLVDDHIFIYKPRYGNNDFDILDKGKSNRKIFTIHPMQMIDMLALMGDASDNIPGCPGIGPKTAQKLLKEFGSVENILNNTDKLKGSVKNKIEENKDQILFSKFLATIKTDVPIEVKIEDFKRKEIDEETLKRIFEKLEFRTLLARVFKNENKKPVQGMLFEEETTNFKNNTIEQTAHRKNYCNPYHTAYLHNGKRRKGTY